MRDYVDKSIDVSYLWVTRDQARWQTSCRRLINPFWGLAEYKYINMKFDDDLSPGITNS